MHKLYLYTFFCSQENLPVMTILERELLKSKQQTVLDTCKEIDLKNNISVSKTEDISNNNINKNVPNENNYKLPSTLSDSKIMDNTVQSYKQCGFCSKKFKQEGRLLAHILKHTGDSSLTCNICFKTYANVGSLTKHYKSHTGEKKSEGDVHNKIIVPISHLNTHTNDKSFICGVCGKAFVRKHNLIKHEKLHTITELK